MALALLVPLPTTAQQTAAPDPRFAGLEWTFARVRYSSHMGDGRRGMFRGGEFDNPWTIDMPAAEQNLSRRLRTATAIEVKDPIVLTLDDPKLWDHGWIYIVYVIVAFMLSQRAGWKLSFLVLLLLAGLVPVLIFFVERKVEAIWRAIAGGTRGVTSLR